MTLAPAAGALAAIAAIAVLAAVTVLMLPDGPAELRGQLAFAFQPGPANLAGALDLALNNSRVCALGLLGAAAQLLYADAPRARTAARAVFDVVLTVSYAANAAQFGLAYGAYGTRLVAWTPHVPLELLALAVSAGAYIRARHGRPHGTELTRAAGCAGALVALAALVETWGVPHT